MTIRRKLALSSGIILLLFGLNLAIYFWSAAKRSPTVDTLARAISRETLIASISQALANLHQEVTLMSGVSAEASGASATPEQRQDFANQIEGVSRDLGQLESDATSVTRSENGRREIEQLRNTFEQLARSWKIYYDNFGINPNVAVVELAVRADPLSERVLKNQLPHLREAEQERVSEARADFARVSRLTDRISVAIFLFSLVLAATVAFLVSRDLVGALSDLTLGTALISAGHPEHRMKVDRRDEIAHVSESFNLM